MKLFTSRLFLALAALGILGAITALALYQRDEPDEASLIERRSPTAELDISAVDRVEIERPNAPKIVLARKGDSFQMLAPLEAAVEPNAGESLLRRLASLEVDSVAATKERHHERLDIDEPRAIKLRLYAAGELLNDLRIGAYRSQTTMIREAGSEIVLSIRNNLRSLVDRDVDELRDKSIFSLDSASIRALDFEDERRSLRFIRESADADFVPAEGVEIEKYNPATLRSRALTLARLRASGFADEEAALPELGLDPPRARVRIELEGGERHELKIGGEEARGVYVKRAGVASIYLLPKATAERMMPKRADLEGEGAMAPASARNADGGGALPAEVLEALERSRSDQ